MSMAGDIKNPELIKELLRDYGKDYSRMVVVSFLDKLAEKG